MMYNQTIFENQRELCSDETAPPLTRGLGSSSGDGENPVGSALQQVIRINRGSNVDTGHQVGNQKKQKTIFGKKNSWKQAKKEIVSKQALVFDLPKHIAILMKQLIDT